MSPHALRLIDTGEHHGRYNIAFDHALIEGHRAGSSPDTLRLLGFTPSALVGRHQDLSREIDVEYCAAHGIDIGRRMTGGGAIYLDRAQLGWELVCARGRLPGGDLAALTAQICTAAATALGRLGVAARFRARNDIEVEGRKIGGTGGFFDGGTLFYQGTLILDLDVATMFRVLRVPPEKRARQQATAGARVTSLKAVCEGRLPPLPLIKSTLATTLATELGFDLLPGEVSSMEQDMALEVYREEIGQAAFVHEIDSGAAALDGWATATRATAGGTLSVALKLGVRGARVIEAVLFSGDFFVTPPRLVYDLEATLRGVARADAADTVRRFFAGAEVELMSMAVDDWVEIVQQALVCARDAAWTT